MALVTEVVNSTGFSSDLISAAYSVYRTCYTPTDRAVFERDFRQKSYAILIRDANDLVGFSTVERMEAERGLRVLFSGDTVMDPKNWGSQALAYTWLRQAGLVWAEAPDRPLYWMLISKGHRTYRYLPAFSRDYYPALDWPTPPRTRALMDLLGRTKFGDRYDVSSGTVRAEPGLPTHVVGEIEGRRPNRYAEFFARKNPGYRRGDELLTLCRLAPETLTDRARRHFMVEVEAA